MADNFWYYMDGDQVVGPRPEKELRGMIRAGKMSAHIYVMRSEGENDWHPAYQAFRMRLNTFSKPGLYKYLTPVVVLFLSFSYLNIYAFNLVEKWGKAGPILWGLSGLGMIGASSLALLQMGQVSKRWNANIPDARARWLKRGCAFFWLLLVLFFAYFMIFWLWGASWSLLK